MAACTADVSCYPYMSGTPGTGACANGTAQCLNGFLGPCIGSVGPSLESCNGIDDDCNGSIDDALGSVRCGIGACQRTASACTDAGVPGVCIAGTPQPEICTAGNTIDEDCDGVVNNGCNCVYVAPNGLDTAAGNQGNPVRHINVAMDLAADAGISSVCVASGTNCPSLFDFGQADAGGETLTMRNGISVYGGYRSGNWNRQPGLMSSNGCDTRLTAQTPEGVLFDQSVTSATSIDGFELIGSPTAASSAAVTVRGSTGAVINDDIISGGSGTGVTTSVGVDVVDGAGIAATPTISRSSVTGAAVSGTAIGVRSTNSAPSLINNCNQFDASGRCSVGCFSNGGVVDSIKGTTGGLAAVAQMTSWGVLLDNSPNAQLDANAICAQVGGTNFANGAGVRIQGNATGAVMRRNNVSTFNGTRNAVGVWADPCGGASPWIFDNFQIIGTSSTAGSRSDGVRAIGDCHVRVDSNRLISGGVEQAGQDTNGVYCALDPLSGIASRCTVLANTLIQGSNNGFPPRSVGVRCDDGACARIEGNGLISGRGGIFSAGIVVSKSGPVIARNVILGGCATTTAIGLQSLDSYARVENNLIRGYGAPPGGGCTASGSTALQIFGVQVTNGATSNELDLHSNSIFPEGRQVGCTSQGLSFDVATDAGLPTGPRGLVRNNVLTAGVCATRYDLAELNSAADPRVLTNNYFERAPVGTVLYLDENATSLVDAGQVNALTDVTSSSNIEGNAGANFTNPLLFHLLPGSVCRNAGGDAGVPRLDFDGDSRPKEGAFDIGADEYVP
jgi:hypothetical protein